MICGHCKDRDVTIEHIKKCSGVKDIESTTLTPGQQAYLRDLLKHFNLVLPEGQAIDKIERRNGKLILDGLLGARRLQAMGREFELPDGVLISPHPKPRRERRPSNRRPSRLNIPVRNDAEDEESELPCGPCSSAAGEEIYHGPLGCSRPNGASK